MFPPQKVGPYLQPLWPKEQELEPLASPLAQPSQLGKPWKMPGRWRAHGPWEQGVCSGGPWKLLLWEKRGPEERGEGKGGMKEAKLGHSSGRLPKWQQGLSRQWVEVEPSR